MLFAKTSSKTISSEVSDLKASIISLASGTSNGVKASPAVADKIIELSKTLVKKNKNKLSKTSNKLMDGRWKLVYTSNKESSAGKVGPFIGEVVQTINVPAVKYTNDVSILSGLFSARLTASFENIPDSSWKVIFESLEAKIFGVKVINKTFNGIGIWKSQYLDEDFRIFYAKSSNKAIENIYIMKKVL